ncbi:MAG: cytochrome b/b6 domain-containing protein [Comamonadaceae bacterium]|nr:cytochrome b/b6 domain-containing protein [Comamonadaceae bacterium]
MSPKVDDLVPRHSNGARVAHWAVAMVFTALFASGLALFQPVLLLALGALRRRAAHALHPPRGRGGAGAGLLPVRALPTCATTAGSRPTPPGRRTWSPTCARRTTRADTAKYNGGQKLMYWSMLPIIAVLAVTGVMLWQPWFAPSFGAGARRVAGLVHAVSAFVMFVGIGVHVYAALWTKGSIDAMIRGTVTRAWARFHHPAWYRQVTGGKDGR